MARKGCANVSQCAVCSYSLSSASVNPILDRWTIKLRGEDFYLPAFFSGSICLAAGGASHEDNPPHKIQFVWKERRDGAKGEEKRRGGKREEKKKKKKREREEHFFSLDTHSGRNTKTGA